MTVPIEVRAVCASLQRGGHTAYLVGGCVRDRKRGAPPKDYDVATSATPTEVMALFTKVIPTGIEHGTVTVMAADTPVEVTTFRTESGYSDGRHPDAVAFVSSIEEDLARRDFTINAMAFDLATNVLVDPFGGARDLELGIIRCVGDPNKRFREDGLRLMRAVRFACRFPAFGIEPKTFEAIQANLDALRSVSMERIRDEFSKIITSKNCVMGMEVLGSTGLLTRFLPEVHQVPWLYAERSDRLESRLAGILIHLDADAVDKVTRRLKYSVAEINQIKMNVAAWRWVSSFFGNAPDVDRGYQMRKFICEFGVENMPALLDFLGAVGFVSMEYEVKNTMRSRPCVSLKALAIRGEDLLKTGISGRDIGMRLRSILEVVLQTPEMNTKDRLLPLVVRGP